MDIRKAFCILSIILFSSLVSAVPVATRLSLAYGDSLYPYDPLAGRLVPASSDPVVALTAEALSREWGPTWVDEYVAPGNRAAFANSFDSLLASILPVGPASFAVVRDAGGADRVVARFGRDPVRYLTVVWEKEDGRDRIVSISLAETK